MNGKLQVCLCFLKPSLVGLFMFVLQEQRLQSFLICLITQKDKGKNHLYLFSFKSKCSIITIDKKYRKYNFVQFSKAQIKLHRIQENPESVLFTTKDLNLLEFYISLKLHLHEMTKRTFGLLFDVLLGFY